MRFRQPLIAALAAFLAILAGTTAARAEQPAGFLDGTDGQAVWGWAWDAENPGSPAEVQLVILHADSGLPAASQTIIADQYRADLKQYGGGCHSFAFSPAANQLPEGSYTVRAFCGGIPLSGIFYWQGGSSAITYSPAPASSANAADTSETPVAFLGVFRTTAYCSCRRCSGRWGRITSSGAVATARHTAAVDPRVIPYGTRLMIDGVVYTAEDEGSGVIGNHIDIYCDTHAEAAAYGLQQKEVYLVY